MCMGSEVFEDGDQIPDGTDAIFQGRTVAPKLADRGGYSARDIVGIIRWNLGINPGGPTDNISPFGESFQPSP